MNIKPVLIPRAQLAEKPVIMGIGGAGALIATYMSGFEWQHASIAICTTDAQELPQNNGNIQTLLLGAPHAKGAGGDIKYGEKIATEELDKIKNFVASLNPNVAILIAGLGKGTGGGITPIVAREFKEKGALTIAIVIWPAEFEGERINRQAQQALERLEEFIDAYGVIRFEKIFLSENNLVTEAGFLTLNETVTQIAYSLSNLFTARGINRISEKDMEAILNSSGKKEILVGVGMSTEQDPQEALSNATSEALKLNYSVIDNIMTSESLQHLIAHIQVDNQKCSLSTNHIYRCVIKHLKDNFHESLTIQPTISIEPIYTGASVAVTLIATGANTIHRNTTSYLPEENTYTPGTLTEESIHRLEKEPAIFRIQKEKLKRLLQQ